MSGKSNPRTDRRREQEAQWAREARRRRPALPRVRVSPAFEAAMRAREQTDVSRVDALLRVTPSHTDRIFLAVPVAERRLRCPVCDALSRGVICANGHRINDLPTEGAA